MTNAPLTPLAGRVFEDTIDGYFPLQVSLAQMMRRNRLQAAWICLTHAPIMDIPDLPPDAPVPLSIHAGRAGMIDRLDLWLWWSADELQLGGQGSWRFLKDAESAPALCAGTRLAEPAYLTGIGIPDLAPVASHPTIARLEVTSAGPAQVYGAAQQLDWPTARLWGPVPAKPVIERRDSVSVLWQGQRINRTPQISIPPGSYLLAPS